jgi:putative transposase
VRRAYKFRLRPTRKQEAALDVCLEDTRQLYNAALEERREAWRMGHHKVTFYSQDAQLKEIRADDPERYGRWAFTCERAAIRRLDRAFQGFFRRVRAGEKPGYPRFKGRGWWDSIEWPEKNGARWDSVPHPKVTRVYLQGIGHVRVHHGIFLRVLSVKAESAGRQVTAVDPRHTSQRCAHCGYTSAGNRVTQAEFRCLGCGHQAHADVNAAINILRAGLALQEAHQAT